MVLNDEATSRRIWSRLYASDDENNQLTFSVSLGVRFRPAADLQLRRKILWFMSRNA